MALVETPLSHFALSAPGKIFILGEYGVLAGLPALIGTFGPRFRLEGSLASPYSSHGGNAWSPHPESPAGLLLRELESQAKEVARFPIPTAMRFWDPHRGKGGMGASTAQFALLWQSVSQGLQSAEFVHEQSSISAAAQCWRLYRRLTRTESGLPPSGADVFAQTAALRKGAIDPGWWLFDSEEPERSAELTHFPADRIVVLLASTQPGRKVPTHTHLNELSPAETLRQIRDALQEPILKAMRALREREQSPNGAHEAWREFAAQCGVFAKRMEALGWVHPETLKDLEELVRFPGVLSAKGAGALQADALVICLDSTLTLEQTHSVQNELKAWAKARGYSVVWG